MKVLEVIPSVSPERGGTSVWLKTMAASVARLGAEVHVATTDDGAPLPAGAVHGKPFAENGVTYWYFPRQTEFYTVSLPLRAWLKGRIREFDVVHIHALFSYPTLPAAWSAQRAGIPYLVQPHGMLSQWGMANRRPTLKKWSLRWMEGRILERSAAVAFTSEHEREEAAGLGVGGRPVTIPLGVDTPDPERYRRERAFFAAHPDLEGRRIILFLSRVDTKKGLELLFGALARVRRAHPEAVLVIAGSGEPGYQRSLEREAERQGVSGCVRWAGFLQGDAKWAALAAADVFALPSYAENFGIAAVEAMLFGLPLLISDQVGIHREVARANAGLVTPCRVDAVAQGLESLLDDGELRRKLGLNALRLARQEYRVSSVTARLFELYRSVASDQACTAARKSA